MPGREALPPGRRKAMIYFYWVCGLAFSIAISIAVAAAFEAREKGDE